MYAFLLMIEPHPDMYIDTYAHIHYTTLDYMHTYIGTYMHRYILTCTNTNIHTYIKSTRLFTRQRTKSTLHTYMHGCIHAYIYKIDTPVSLGRGRKLHLRKNGITQFQ